MADDRNAVEVQLQMAQTEPLDPLAAELDRDTLETANPTISRPLAGETLTVATLGGMVYALDLDPTQAQVLIEAGDLILLFEDGGRIVFENLVGLAQAGNSPGLEIDGTVIGGDVLLGQALALASGDEVLGDEPLTLETAAGGEGAGGGGSSQYQDDFNEIISTLFAEGPIPFTDLAFRSFGGATILTEDPPAPAAGITPPLGTLIVLGPGLDPSFGTPPDGAPGSVAAQTTGAGYFGEDAAAPGALRASVGTPGANEAITEIRVEGLPTSEANGWQIDVAGLRAAVESLGGSLDVSALDSAGTLVISFPAAAGIETFDALIGFTPPVNSDQDFPGVDVIVTAQNTETGETATGRTDDITLVVDAVVDGTEVLVDGQVVGPATVIAGAASGATDLGLSLDAFDQTSRAGAAADDDAAFTQGGGDTDGSETVTQLVITLTPSDGSFGAPTLLFTNPDPGAISVSQTSAAGGSITYSFSVQAGTPFGTVDTLLDSFAVDRPDPGFGGDIAISIQTTTEETGVTDAEPDLGNNADTDSYSYTVSYGGTPVTGLVVNGAVGYIPEDVPAPVTIQADVAAGSSDVLTQVVVTGLPLNGSGWTIDPSQLSGLPGVVSASFDGASGTLTITFDPSAGITDFDGDLIMRPPTNSDVDLNGVQVQATAVNPTSGAPATNTPTTHDVPVDAVVDGSQVTQAAPVSGGQDQNVNLDLDIGLGGDTSTGGTPGQTPFESQGGTDGDGSESVTAIQVTLSAGTLTFSAPVGTVVSAPANPGDPWLFDTSGLSLADLQALVDSFGVTPPAGYTGTIDITLQTTTAEAATAAGGGDVEVFDPDNADVDSYQFQVNFTGIPVTGLVINGSTGYIPEDVPAPVTIQADVAAGSADVLTQVVVTGLPLNGSGWTIDPSQLSGLPGVVSASFDGTSGTLTITFDPSAGITDFDGDLIVTPPANSDVDLNGVQVQATAVNPTSGAAATNTPTMHDVPVDAVVDGSQVTQAAPASGAQGDTVNLDLDINLGGDSTTGGTPGLTPFESQGGTDVDGSESITAIRVTLTAGTLAFTDPAGALVSTPANPSGPWLFDTSSLGLSQVQALVDSFGVSAGPDFFGIVGVTIETTTAEAATAAGGGSAAAGDQEIFDPDNVDVDQYYFQASFTGDPVTCIIVNGAEGFILEDSEAPVTIQASPAVGSSDVLTEIVVTGLPTIAAGWLVDASQLGGLPGVIGVNWNPAAGALTVTFDPAAGITDFEGDLLVTPPTNSDVDWTGVQIQATAVNPTSGAVATSDPLSHDIVVDAIVDGTEVLRDGQVIGAHDMVAGDENSIIDLELSLDLSDQTSKAGAAPDDDEWFTQGGGDGDGSETVKLVSVTLSPDSAAYGLPALLFTLPAGIAVDSLNGVPSSDGSSISWLFSAGDDTDLATVNSLIESLQIQPAPEYSGDIGVTLETTTTETALNGVEMVAADNSDIDSYSFQVWVEPLPGTLVVGSNENDDPAAPAGDPAFDHTVPNPATLPDNDGAIAGLPGDDVLVGDPGGAAADSIPPGDYNVVLILDVSSSMRADAGNGQTRLELLQDAVNNLLAQLADHDGVVNVFIQPFSAEAVTPIEFSNFDLSSLADAQSFVDALVTLHWTNYQDGLLEGASWLEGQLAVTDDFTNLMFFVSDGNPNTINGGRLGGSSAQDALEAALSEPVVADALDQSSGIFTGADVVQVNAIGIGSGVTESILDQVDNTPDPGSSNSGDAQIVNSPDELGAALAQGFDVVRLLDVGEDLVSGGSGSDLIFGDVPNTDALRDSLGLDPDVFPNGGGWAVFQHAIDTLGWTLDAGGTFDPAVPDVRAYLEESGNWAELTAGSRGEADSLDGGDGDDVLFGQGGDDVLTGGAGDDLLVGGDGADVFVFDLGLDSGSDEISDFDPTEGDVIRFDNVVDGLGDELQDLNEMIESITQDGPGGNVTVQFTNGATVQINGAGTGMDPIDNIEDAISQVQIDVS